jgi:hypothetical protein
MPAQTLSPRRPTCRNVECARRGFAPPKFVPASAAAAFPRPSWERLPSLVPKFHLTHNPPAPTPTPTPSDRPPFSAFLSFRPPPSASFPILVNLPPTLRRVDTPGVLFTVTLTPRTANLDYGLACPIFLPATLVIIGGTAGV